jgi:hypothetical protein
MDLRAILQRETDQPNLKKACQVMKTVVMTIFTKNECLFSNTVSRAFDTF